MTYNLSKLSRERLVGVHPKLVAVVERAIQLTTQDFLVLCGVRTLAEQKKLYAQGRTAPGKIVTWTMKSRHLPASDGFGHAVDLCPYPVDWNDLKKFDAIATAMFAAAKELDTPLRYGADWDGDGIRRERGENDSPHWELAL